MDKKVYAVVGSRREFQSFADAATRNRGTLVWEPGRFSYFDGAGGIVEYVHVDVGQYSAMMDGYPVAERFRGLKFDNFYGAASGKRVPVPPLYVRFDMEYPKEQTFWMVWGKNRSVPTVQHGTYLAAQAEASRLAKGSPGIQFYVLRAVAAVGCPDPSPVIESL